MLAEYMGEVFNAEIKENKVDLWKYTPADGFKMTTTIRGTTCYEKTVDLENIECFFSVRFIAVRYDCREFIIKNCFDDSIEIICDDAEYAVRNHFAEAEHGVWITRLKLTDFERFEMVLTDENSLDAKVIKLDKGELMKTWERYVQDVSI